MKISSFFSHFLWLTPFASFLCGYLLLALLDTNDKLQTPAIVGQTLEHALIQLSNQNLNLRIIGHKKETDFKEGTILQQMPAAGTAIKENQSIFVIASCKPNAQIVPDFKGKTLDEVKLLIEQLQIPATIYFLPYDANVSTCIAQHPAPGQSYDKEQVIIYISEPKPLIMPPLTGKLLQEVTEALERQGIIPTIIHLERQDLNPHHQCHNCKIVSQQPKALSLIRQDPHHPIQIQLYVN